jgi:exosortase C (VPDSG-CTERM-specific)
VDLVFHSLRNDLHSHIVLVPLISAYLLYTHPRPESTETYQTSIGGMLILGIVGGAALGAAVAWRETLSASDGLTLTTLAYVSLVTAAGFVFMGSGWMRTAAFPLAFLLFMVPLPDRAVHWLETASVLGSAEASALFFQVSGTPFLREGTVFALPGIALEVARECSGIRSSWVLFITSLLASTLFLKSRWHRLVLVAFVLPLAIVRNGLRILTIGLLSVHVGPHMIDSLIHRRGGPIFFAMSLVPLFLLLWWLRHRERLAQPAGRRW